MIGAKYGTKYDSKYDTIFGIILDTVFGITFKINYIILEASAPTHWGSLGGLGRMPQEQDREYQARYM